MSKIVFKNIAIVKLLSVAQIKQLLTQIWSKQFNHDLFLIRVSALLIQTVIIQICSHSPLKLVRNSLFSHENRKTVHLFPRIKNSNLLKFDLLFINRPYDFPNAVDTVGKNYAGKKHSNCCPNYFWAVFWGNISIPDTDCCGDCPVKRVHILHIPVLIFDVFFRAGVD